jgi:hypothetical protein
MSAKSFTMLLAALIAAVALTTPAEAAGKKAVRHRTKHSSRVHAGGTETASSTQKADAKSKRAGKPTAKATTGTAKSGAKASTRTAKTAAKGTTGTAKRAGKTTAKTTKSAVKSVKKPIEQKTTTR